MFDHIALGIVLPGPITPIERKRLGHFKHQRHTWRWITGHDATNNQYGTGILDPDFDDPPQFTLAEPELPHPPGAEQ